MNLDVIRTINILEFRRSPTRIKKRQVLDWLLSDDPNVIAAAVDAVLMHNDNILPKLNYEEILDALQRNFMLNLSTERAPTLYGHSCYEAGRALLMWVGSISASGYLASNPEAIRRLSANLSELYMSSSGKQRDCIVNGVLEHLFEIDGVRECFEFWRGHEVLGEAYENAKRWSDWSREQLAALEDVAEKAASLLRQGGYIDAFVSWPTPGSALPAIALGEDLLMISCDTSWTELFREHRLDLDAAARFAADEKNWQPASEMPRTRIVELTGRTFEVLK